MSGDGRGRPGDGGKRVANDRTLGEVVRVVEELKQEVRALVARVEQNYVRKDVYDAQREADEKRLSALESSREWLVRTVGALVIAGVVGLLLAVKP